MERLYLLMKWHEHQTASIEETRELIDLLLEERQKGGEQGSLHRNVGATVGADGGQRKCPREGCDNGWIWDQVEPIEGPWPCPTCKGAGVVEYTVAIERSDTGAAMKPSGSPPLGPQARSGEESEPLTQDENDLKNAYLLVRHAYNESKGLTRWLFFMGLAEPARDFLRAACKIGMRLSWRADEQATASGSEHRGPNGKVSND